MDQQTLINTLMGIVTAGIGWWVKTIWATTKEQQKDIRDLYVKLAENYVPRAEIDHKLGRLQDSIDQIARALRVPA